MKPNTYEYELGSLRNEILEIVRQLPDITSREIATLLGHLNEGTIFSMVNKLKNDGVLLVTQGKPMMMKNGHKKTLATYRINPDPKPLPLVKNKNRKPTVAECRHEANMQVLRNKIAELESWKATAIKRYPDLGVSPAVFKARAMVAQEYTTMGNLDIAESVLAGERDDSPMMRLALKAMEATQ